MITEHKILVGDCRETLKTLPAESAHVCVTSPPYWGLRDYQTGSTAEIGSEPTLDDHLANIVDVYREVRRVLRPDALSFLNYGDAFAGGKTGRDDKKTGGGLYGGTQVGWDNTATRNRPVPPGFKQKDLMCLPHRVAMALQADGWYLRQCIIWCKGSPMPESVRGSRWERCRVKVAAGKWRSGGNHSGTVSTGRSIDMAKMGMLAQWQPCPGCDKCRDTDGYVYRQSAGRPTTAHEFVFLLSKSPSYYYAMDENRAGYADDRMGDPGNYTRGGNGNPYQRQTTSRPVTNPAGRNLWSYWTDISPSAFKDSHFATMPLDLARRCIKLGTSSVGVCSACGAPWAPVVDVEQVAKCRNVAPIKESGGRNAERAGSWSASYAEQTRTQTAILGHRPTCTCSADKSPAVVLDPFGGAGTTAIAARELGHSSIICELNNEYAAMAKRRERRHFSKPKTGTAVKPATGQVELF